MEQYQRKREEGQRAGRETKKHEIETKGQRQKRAEIRLENIETIAV